MFANAATNTKCTKFTGRHADIGSAPDTIGDALYQPSWGHAFYASPPVDDAGPSSSETYIGTGQHSGTARAPLMGTT